MGRGVEAGDRVDGGGPIARQRSLARDGVGGGATSVAEAKSVAGWCSALGRVGSGGREPPRVAEQSQASSAQGRFGGGPAWDQLGWVRRRPTVASQRDRRQRWNEERI
jgi:hypothetical protein